MRSGEEAHVATCGASLVTCKYGCQNIRRSDLEEHYAQPEPRHTQFLNLYVCVQGS